MIGTKDGKDVYFPPELLFSVWRSIVKKIQFYLNLVRKHLRFPPQKKNINERNECREKQNSLTDAIEQWRYFRKLVSSIFATVTKKIKSVFKHCWLFPTREIGQLWGTRESQQLSSRLIIRMIWGSISLATQFCLEFRNSILRRCQKKIEIEREWQRNCSRRSAGQSRIWEPFAK